MKTIIALLFGTLFALAFTKTEPRNGWQQHNLQGPVKQLTESTFTQQDTVEPILVNTKTFNSKGYKTQEKQEYSGVFATNVILKYEGETVLKELITTTADLQPTSRALATKTDAQTITLNKIDWGEPLLFGIFKYNTVGDLINVSYKINLTDKSREFDLIQRYDYDTHHYQTAHEVDNFNTGTHESITYTNDDKGNPISESVKITPLSKPEKGKKEIPTQQWTSHYTYTFDSWGNWITRTTVSGTADVPVLKKRIIEYYK
ncbi:hypothetical protein [Flavobacterium kingsejongi]|uniref:Uncharacterized protein n=1 Tax=Flavobacterium kingsejongi TaxID=1678728 RepID=A0A2S1LPB7_9FLAO|nr:hypothetical protein [Flavobacterium kingsejongi]AWG25607.1 hypothetical protein FK004_10375 [Flavobacterium kingsejongi]